MNRRNRWRNQGRVYFDGTAFTKATLAQERTEERRAAEARPGLCPDAQMIQQYLNSRAPHLFTQTVTKHIENARAVVETLELGKTPKAQRDTREAQRRILRRIEDQPQPFYGASRDGNTVRLIAPESLQSLQKDVRLALAADWAEADLRCSQLAICGTLWDVPPVLDFLKTGQSIWEYLGRVISVPDHLRAKTKKPLKDALYATCYGMEKSDVQRAVTRDLNPYGIRNAGSRFVEDNLIVALLG